ncbi:MAG TPA: phosphoribosylglycinamide formyltransferase [Vicinamibacterales bacterium]|nr:phosphoribosylglycinamide formyltransferase [Vicinamibacterales bacterium]
MNIGVLASHEGSTLQVVLDACAECRISGRVVVVISNNGGARALERARQAGVAAVHLSSHTHADADALDVAIRDALKLAKVDLVFLAGYVKQLGPRVLAEFQGRILNTHPALLPKFGGKGMYGDRVFEAVLQAGESETGISIHHVESHYDTGATIAQCRVPVLRGDSVATLKARVQDREKPFVVDTLAAIAAGRIRLATAG